MAGIFGYMPGERNVTVRRGVGGADLLGSGALDPGEARSLGLISALGQMQQAGLQRTATPMGSIAQNLIPLFSAMIYAKAAERSAAQQQQVNQIHQVLAQAQLAKALQPAKITPDQLAGEAIRSGDEETLKKIEGYKKSIQKPSAPTEAGLLQQANPNASPAEILQQIEGLKDRRARMASDLIAQRTEQVRADSEQRAQNKIDQQVVDKTGGVYVIDKTTGQRVPGATAGNLRQGSPDYNPNLMTIKETNFQVLNKAKQASQMLDQLEALVPKVLPSKSDSYFDRAMTLTGIKAKKQLGTNEEVTQFDMLSKFVKMPTIMVLNNLRRLPKSEIDALVNFSRDSDTQEAAKSRISEARSWLTGAVDDMGVSPAALTRPGSDTSDSWQGLGNGLQIKR